LLIHLKAIPARRLAAPVPRRGGHIACTLALALALPPATAALLDAPSHRAFAAGTDDTPVRSRHLGVQQRGRAADRPRSEADQRLVDGWPLYRTERGQTAFNDTMATLAGTETGHAPDAAAFRNCASLACSLELPAMDRNGWLPQGRIWLSPTSYVLLVQSQRMTGMRAYRRRSAGSMRVFVFHEFHNSSRNVDPYDTISSHSGAVFVPFYMSKEATDARGRKFVAIIQVAPYDVSSIHASNYGSAGPGVEVASNTNEAMQPLQGQAGILLATFMKRAAPGLRVVNHRGSEGREMLRGWESHLASRGKGSPVALPFVPVTAERLGTVKLSLGALVRRPGVSPPLALAERTFTPPKADRLAVRATAPAAAPAAAVSVEAREPQPAGRPAGPEGIVTRIVRSASLSSATVRADALAMPRLIEPIRLAERPRRMDAPEATEPVAERAEEAPERADERKPERRRKARRRARNRD
jgi:hypothetical protein